MEIDFLGLNSPKYSMERHRFEDAFADTGGVEISLSLSTNSSFDSHNYVNKKIPSCSGSSFCNLAPKAEQPSLLTVAPPVVRHSAAGFLYDLNDASSANSRNITELPAEAAASLTMLYSGCPSVFNEPEKVELETTMFLPGNVSSKLSTGGTPTVAMARRATLARFLEKRSHRMKQGRTSHLMGKPLNATKSEAGETTSTTSNKKWKNSLNER